MGWRCFVAAALGAHCALAAGQATVYEARDQAGAVYSDKPSPGAKAVDLPPPNVVELPRATPPATLPPAAAPLYRSLSIVSLANEATVHTNSGAFEFSARSVPAMRASDRIRIRLDGRLLPAAFRSTNLRVSEADWRSAPGGERPDHRLQLVIVDAQGRVLIESAAVRFYAQRSTVKGRAR